MNAEALRQLYTAGHQQWPSIDLAFEAFAEHCVRLWPSPDGPEFSSHPGDLYLCSACASGVAEATIVLAREGSPVARLAIARIDRDPEFVQDVLQELWQKLLVGPEAKVREYAGRGPLQAWLKVAATRLALDRVRARKNARETPADVSARVAGYAPDPEWLLIRERHGHAFQDALRRALARLSAQERNVLRMHVVGRCSIDQIGRAYSIHRATAARWLERTRAKIYEAARQELSVGSRACTESEFRSLARQLGTDLELSLFDPSVS